MSRLSDDESSLERSFNASSRSNGHRNPLRHARSSNSLGSVKPQVESSISETVILEQRDKFTLYKVMVNEGQQNWVIYRRYRDFMLLNRKLVKAFPRFRLTLPGRRIFRDNFDKDFIERRQQGLEEFMKNVLSHRDIVQNVNVQRFFRFDNPPQPHECLEACQSYAQSLEGSLARLRSKLRDQNAEIEGLKSEISRAKYHNNKENDESEKDQNYDVMVEEATKNLREQLKISQENEQKLKCELEHLREEIKSEKVSLEATRHLERKERELKFRNDMLKFSEDQEAINSAVQNLVTIVNDLNKVSLNVGGKTYEVKADEGISQQIITLKKAIEKASNDVQTLHRNGLAVYQREAENLQIELQRESLQSQMRIKEAAELKLQLEKCEMQYREALKTQDDYIRSLRRSLHESQVYRNSTEEKYFYSLVIGVKLNMAARGNRIVHINQLNPMTLFERVRNHGISIEHWPSWLSRELATASSWGEDLS